MNTRQREVLGAIVKLYTETAQPVGSEALLERYHFDVSAATLRNDMLALEEEGYLHQPHTSAGRIPTDQGYRYYVSEMMREYPLSHKEQENLEKEFLILKAKHMRLARTTARLLSTLSGNLAVAGVIGKEDFSDFGMKELIEKPEFQEMDTLAQLVEMLDTLDEKVIFLAEGLSPDETRIYIGEENPLSEVSNNMAMIVAPYQNSEGERGILAIIGPKRMEYARNKSLIEYMKKLLSSSLVIIVAGNVIYFT
ncbi:MAG: hypothetical protein ABI747_04495 [Candidatus Moraniibacteriota bacterium]